MCTNNTYTSLVYYTFFLLFQIEYLLYSLFEGLFTSHNTLYIQQTQYYYRKYHGSCPRVLIQI